MTTLLWESGSAYDFFIALYVLHHPQDFGVRPTWAAGMRSRLPAPQRALLETAQTFMGVPLTWLHGLPEQAKEAYPALQALAALPPTQRLQALLWRGDFTPAAGQALEHLMTHGEVSLEEREILREALTRRGRPLRPEAFQALLHAAAQAEAFGSAYLEALETFWRVFFQEEEARLRPWLARGLEEAQALARRTDLPNLLEVLSGGVHFEALEGAPELVLVPSYWSTPLVFYSLVRPGRWMLVFGCRPPQQSLLPGENLPEMLLNRLKALADPTRLHILRYLAQGPQTPAQLARRLRLRAPTVVHHLQALRVAGLVHITITREGERLYALHPAAVRRVYADLEAFLDVSEAPPTP
ncbi:metalloregulator ArsR/SmtB family transcription factor [uncultured Thermanaerothrix sp.]|uniref:ArsR/SmtB family transcription factor n=1 Tax=uncultured Thermanaerothrix sp. TaxID=1195149 RepID=UPI0026130D7A|nr:metalloregulator ArsR/SmtB family transcription factor [uncultured Thermanaerothrix sp.]